MTTEETGAMPDNNTQETQEQEPPAWFREFAERVDGKFQKFGQDFGKLREKVRSTETATETEPKESDRREAGGLSKSDLDAMRRLGRIEHRLTEKQRERIDELADSNGYRYALTFAESLIDFAPEGATPSAPKATGQARSEATSPAKSKPLSQKQYLELKQKDPEFYKELMNDPMFDPFTLPQMTRDEYDALRGNGIK